MISAEINGEQVIRSIIGTVEWATETLGGTWVDAHDIGVGPGWTYVEGEFRYPPTYPSWVWADGDWHAPVPKPTEPAGEGLMWRWDEDTISWVAVEIPEA